MSRVFKRPMFRKGGNVGEGIMTGIRDNYEVGGSAEEQLAKIAEKYPEQGFDPLTQFLIQGGLNLVSQPSTGGVLSDIATAAKDPTEQLFKGMAEKGKLARELAIAGKQLDIEQAGKERLQKEKLEAEQKRLEREIQGRKEIVGMEKGEGVFKPEDFFEEYGSLTQAKNRTDYENLDLETKANQAFGQLYKGFIGGKHGRLKDFEKKSNIANIYYDVTDGTFKQLRKTKDGYAYKTLDTETYDPDTDKKTPPPKEPPSGLFGQKSKPKKTFKEAFNIGDVAPFDPYSS
jgi:hypothetical protein